MIVVTPKSLMFNYDNEYFPTKFYDVNKSTYGKYSDNNRYSFDVEKTKKGNIIFNK